MKGNTLDAHTRASDAPAPWGQLHTRRLSSRRLTIITRTFIDPITISGCFISISRSGTRNTRLPNLVREIHGLHSSHPTWESDDDLRSSSQPHTGNEVGTQIDHPSIDSQQALVAKL
jgi:hypothetical protein